MNRIDGLNGANHRLDLDREVGPLTVNGKIERRRLLTQLMCTLGTASHSEGWFYKLSNAVATMRLAGRCGEIASYNTLVLH